MLAVQGWSGFGRLDLKNVLPLIRCCYVGHRPCPEEEKGKRQREKGAGNWRRPAPALVTEGGKKKNHLAARVSCQEGPWPGDPRFLFQCSGNISVVAIVTGAIWTCRAGPAEHPAVTPLPPRVRRARPLPCGAALVPVFSHTPIEVTVIQGSCELLVCFCFRLEKKYI